VGIANDEDQLEKRLTERGSVDFVETPLREAADRLSRQFQVPIVLAYKKLEDVGVSSDTRITKQLNGIPLESILRLILAELDLGFTVRNNVILISTPEDLESHLNTRVYPVLDLVREPRVSAKDAPLNAGDDYTELIDLLQTTIKPDSWEDVGGPGAICQLSNAGALVVTQTREVHPQIEGLLVALRRAKTYQGILSLPPPAATSYRTTSRPTAGSMRLVSPTPAHSWQLPQVYPAEKSAQEHRGGYAPDYPAAELGAKTGRSLVIGQLSNDK
jgi:hypothetical protein